MVTSAMECQWYCRASRAAYSASPWVVSGLGLKQISLTPGTGGAHGPGYGWAQDGPRWR